MTRRSIGTVIRLIRLASGETQADTAAQAGLSRTTLSLIESDQRPPTPQQLQRIVEALTHPDYGGGE